MLGLSFEADRPPLTRENEVVFEVWRFCGGWNPAVLPLAAVFYGIADLEFLILQLIALRACFDEREKALRDTEG